MIFVRRIGRQCFDHLCGEMDSALKAKFVARFGHLFAAPEFRDPVNQDFLGS